MTRRSVIALLCLSAGAAAFAARPRQEAERVLFEALKHLGNDPAPEWQEAALEPEGTELRFRFKAQANRSEVVLSLRQRSIDNDWKLYLNGKEITILRKRAESVRENYVVPPGALIDGENDFAILPDQPTDDVVVGDVRLIEQTLREYLGLRPVVVRVSDSRSGEPLPARVTVVAETGELAPLYYAEALQTATREGVLYTSQGEATFEVAAGSYRVFATRGSEWGLGEAALVVGSKSNEVSLSMRREVDTTGFIACDTHVHTLTFSGHGDSSVEERMVTLAGEGVELAIATDHNHNTDYAPYQERMELTSYFTPVVGNEVTTPVGHFNAFPLDPEDDVPTYDLQDLFVLVDGMRAKGAQVVILNHPRWPDHERGPFGTNQLDPFTGATTLGRKLTVDAMELVNSDTKEDQPFVLFEDWFALLNHGETIMAVGSSDSHTVGHPVGEGRTYIQSSTDDPAALDVDECCRNIVAGRSSVSLGIFCEVTVNGNYRMGDLAPAPDGRIQVQLRVAAPSWIRPQRAQLFVNGQLTREVTLDTKPGVPTDVELPLSTLLEFKNDAWLVCAVMGEPMSEPYWPMTNNYTLGATNPVFIDRDGDGLYTSPRDAASAVLERVGSKGQQLLSELGRVDEAVAIQALDLIKQEYLEQALRQHARVGNDVGRGRERIEAYLESLAPE